MMKLSQFLHYSNESSHHYARVLYENLNIRTLDDISVKSDFSLSRTHHIWHYGRVAEGMHQDCRFALDVEGCTRFYLKDTSSGTEISCRIEKQDLTGMKVLLAYFVNDDQYLDIKDGLVDSDLLYGEMESKRWVLKLLDIHGSVIQSIPLDKSAEFLSEALEDSIEIITEGSIFSDATRSTLHIVSPTVRRFG